MTDLPEFVDEETIARLVAEAEAGIPAEKLRLRIDNRGTAPAAPPTQ